MGCQLITSGWRNRKFVSVIELDYSAGSLKKNCRAAIVQLFYKKILKHRQSQEQAAEICVNDLRI